MSNMKPPYPIALAQKPHKLALREDEFNALTLPPKGDDDGDDEIDLRQLWDTVRRHKWTIVGIALLIFIIVTIVTLMMPPQYRSTVTLKIDLENSAKVLNYDVEAQSTRPVNDKDFYQTQYELLKSRSLARRVIDQLNLYPNDAEAETQLAKPFFADALEQLETVMRGEEDGASRERLGAYPVEEKFLKGMAVEPVKNSSLVKVSYSSKDPELAQRITNEIAAQYISLNLERRVDSTSYAKTFLDDQLAQAKSKLEESESKLVGYAKREQIINTDDKRSLSSQRMEALDKAVTEAEKDRILAEGVYEQAKLGDTAAAIAESTNIQSLKERYSKLESDYQEKLQVYKADYPLMVEISQQMGIINQQINKEIGSARDTLKAKYLAAKQQEDSLRKKLETQKGDLLDVRDKSIGYNTLEREVETNRNMYESLLQRIKEVGVAGNIDKNNITVIDEAVLPYNQFSPNVTLNLALGLVGGLFIGMVIAFMLEFLDDRIKTKEALEKLLSMPVLGMIPRAKSKDEKQAALMGHLDPRSAIGEAFRSLRTSMLFATREGAPKVLHVTSSMPGEGKSSICVNTATAFAQSGKRVLLIDCDLRKPSLHQKLKLDNYEGMSNFLTYQSEAKQVIRHTDIPNVDIITAGPLSPNPAELLLSDRMSELLKLVPVDYDMIIIDSPPIMGLADALILSNWANATLLVATFAQSRKKPLLDAYQRLRHARSHVIGSILTKVKSGGAGYGYSYEYHYTYGGDSKSDKGEKKRISKAAA
ncbi:polysaccharide biosynthesis tyrosine autokinase [Thiothrix fructosivorans]|uniref:non-specific protein-tyrosine kinase n=2 Tax=Thiothrix fructosivorans TaxID=111770 RepID=A0ABS3IMX0_9GAMM|nr:polysaccharide biosynthesis tyrosine autokinase [Thiothrix fructosivorans]